MDISSGFGPEVSDSILGAIKDLPNPCDVLDRKIRHSKRYVVGLKQLAMDLLSGGSCFPPSKINQNCVG